MTFQRHVKKRFGVGPDRVCQWESDIINTANKNWRSQGRCLPASDYTATAYCRNGIKDEWGHWCKTTKPTEPWRGCPLYCRLRVKLVSPIKKERWSETPWKRFKDIYRYDCDAYKQNPREYREVGIEEIRQLKLKKPPFWERQCRELEEKFLKSIRGEIKEKKEAEEWVEKNNTAFWDRIHAYRRFCGRSPKNHKRQKFHYELRVTMENLRKCQKSNKLILNIAKRWVNEKKTFAN